MGDIKIQEQQSAPDFTLPAVGSEDVVVSKWYNGG
jgi:hypothetical protein